MKGKIFLSGGGDLKDAEKLDSIFFSHLNNNAKILYIPIALKRDRLGFEACYDWFSDVISHHAHNKDIDFSMILEEDFVPDLKNYDAVYIGGGNTFKLLNYIIEKSLDSKIKDYIENGGLVYGGSAGAIIFGKDINTVMEENDNNYIHHNGLDYLSGKSLICHYESHLDEKIIDSQIFIGEEIIALQENEGLIVSENKIEVVGTPHCFLRGVKRKFEQ